MVAKAKSFGAKKLLEWKKSFRARRDLGDNEKDREEGERLRNMDSSNWAGCFLKQGGTKTGRSLTDERNRKK